MGLFYKDTESTPIIGTVVNTTDNNGTILTATRTGWQLESTYQAEGTTKATKSFSTSGYSKLNLDILYTMGATESANSIEIKVEGSTDNVNFYRLPNESASAGTSTITAREFTFVGSDAAAASISIGLDIFYKFMRVSAKETGVASNKGNVFIDLTLLG